ncbi:aminotransferase class I/II-fold pyridoxal phosphate-dependent enzyme [bacterium]|nr:aminotransferase class I/II-fold pyridoxal phosphate-dependent enzyme [bacterium]
MTIRSRDFDTCVHAAKDSDPLTGAVVKPIHTASTYEQKAPAEHLGYDYSRADNPTREAYEKALAAVEVAQHGLAFSSGLAAEQAVIQLLDPGAEVIVCDDVYGGTGRMFRTLFAKYDLKFHFVDMSNLDNVAAALNEKTRLVWVESPTNPLLKVIDVVGVAKLLKGKDCQFLVDNTFASPVFQSPLELGASIVLHSSSKYIGGHSDLIGGALMVNDPKLFQSLKYVQFAAGAIPSPMDCHLFHRSLSTLAIRMKKHEENAFAVAEFLETHPKVDVVFYPGLESHPQHAIAKEQMRGFSGIVSFKLKGNYEDVKTFLAKLRMFRLAESLGCVESLVNHPEKMTHASVPEKMREHLGIDSQLLRLSVGIESSESLVSDLQNALN